RRVNCSDSCGDIYLRASAASERAESCYFQARPVACDNVQIGEREPALRNTQVNSFNADAVARTTYDGVTAGDRVQSGGCRIRVKGGGDDNYAGCSRVAGDGVACEVSNKERAAACAVNVYAVARGGYGIAAHVNAQLPAALPVDVYAFCSRRTDSIIADGC